MITIHEVKGEYTISSHGVWRPGVYASEIAAIYAFKFKDSDLSELQKEKGIITLEDLKLLKNKNFPVFYAKEKYHLKGRGDVYMIKSDRECFFNEATSVFSKIPVVIDGELFQVKGVEAFAKEKILKGDDIGLLVEKLNY